MAMSVGTMGDAMQRLRNIEEQLAATNQKKPDRIETRRPGTKPLRGVVTEIRTGNPAPYMMIRLDDMVRERPDLGWLKNAPKGQHVDIFMAGDAELKGDSFADMFQDCTFTVSPESLKEQFLSLKKIYGEEELAKRFFDDNSIAQKYMEEMHKREMCLPPSEKINKFKVAKTVTDSIRAAQMKAMNECMAWGGGDHGNTPIRFMLSTPRDSDGHRWDAFRYMHANPEASWRRGDFPFPIPHPKGDAMDAYTSQYAAGVPVKTILDRERKKHVEWVTQSRHDEAKRIDKVTQREQLLASDRKEMHGQVDRRWAEVREVDAKLAERERSIADRERAIAVWTEADHSVLAQARDKAEKVKAADEEARLAREGSAKLAEDCQAAAQLAQVPPVVRSARMPCQRSCKGCGAVWTSPMPKRCSCGVRFGWISKLWRMAKWLQE